jgi:phosphoglycerate dehydrogenase-like enzyme
MPKVLLAATTLKNLEGRHLTLIRDAGLELVTPEPWDRQLTEADLLRCLPGVAATIAGMEPYTPRVFGAAPDLRVIARVGVGYDAVDVAAATAAGVAVTITPGANHDCVAEHTFALILALLKSVVSSHNATVRGDWKRLITVPLRGQTLGIVGLGRIGRAVAMRAKAFQMRVIAYEVNPDRAFVQREGVELVAMDRLLAEADIVTLHVPMLPSTKHLINARTIAMMKPTAYLINTARGGLVQESDLVDALRARRLAGAGLDVFTDEPPPAGHPFFALDNVVLTPHSAGTDHQSRLDMAESAARSVVELLHGGWPGEAVVNPEVRGRWPRGS